MWTYLHWADRRWPLQCGINHLIQTEKEKKHDDDDHHKPVSAFVA
jgi:hypothetical protein